MLGCFALRGNVLTILFSTDHSGNPDPGVSKYLENIQCFDKLTLLVGWQEGHPAYNNFPIPKDSSSFFYRVTLCVSAVFAVARLIGSHMRSIEWWHFNDLDGPLTRFSRSRHFWSRIHQNGVSYGQSYYRMLTGNHIESIEWYHFQWLWLTPYRDF